MTLDRLEKVNIKSLVLEEPSLKGVSDAPFDPERDLTQDDWEALNREVERVYDSTQTIVFLAWMAKIISPKIIERLDLDNLWERTKNDLEYTWTHKDAQQLAFIREAQTSNALLLFPDKRDEIRTYYEGFKSEIIEEFNLSDPELSTHEYLFFPKLIMFPELISNLRLNEDVKEQQRRYLEDTFPVLDDMLAFLDSAAFFKLIYQEQPFHLTEQDWEAMRDRLNYRIKDSKVRHSHIIFIVYNMKILAAEEARITNSGEVEVVMNKSPLSLTEVVPPLPETRKF